MTVDREAIASLLDRLHRHKDAAYGDAWRRRGEILGIFANMARKYDRLVIAMAETDSSGTEPLADTISDLVVYSCKYLSWIAEVDPRAFNESPAPATAQQAAAINGPDAVTLLLGLLCRDTEDPGSSAAAWQLAAEAFEELEATLVAQTSPERVAAGLLDYTGRCGRTFDLASALMWFLVHLAADMPHTLEAIRDDVDRMDQRAAR